MGTVHKAKQMQQRASTAFAAEYLKAKGYSLSSALWILCRSVRK